MNGKKQRNPTEVMQPLEGDLQSDSADSPPRDTLGGFRLVRKIASGGMATVYLGVRDRPGKTPEVAAIKVMTPSFANDSEYVEMFFDEARLTAAIRHPYVCRVLDYGVKEDLHYLATEYVLGETWADLVEVLHTRPEARSVAAPLLAHVAAQVCRALHAVHETRDERGMPMAIVHRDVSPRNIMVAYDGSVRILDFGIASAAERLHETRNGVLKGHVAYMAPEQVELQRVDRRCDLWAVGVLLWEGVSGKRLFKRASMRESMKAISSEPLAPLLREGAPLVPAPIMAIIERCVARNPAARYKTAQHLQADLEKLPLSSTPMTNQEVSSWMRHLFADRLEHRTRRLESALDPTAKDATVTQSSVRATTRLDDTEARTRTDAEQIRERGTSTGLRARLPSLLRTHAKPLAGAAVLAALAGGLWVLRSPAIHAPADPAAQTNVQIQGASPKPAAEPGAKGVVEVVSRGAPVQVHVQGKLYGETPVHLELTPGKHTLHLVSVPLGASADTDVTVDANARFVVEIDSLPQGKK